MFFIHLYFSFLFCWTMFLFFFFSISLEFYLYETDEPRKRGKVTRASCKSKNMRNIFKFEKKSGKKHQIGIRVQTEMTFVNDFSLETHVCNTFPYPDFYCKYKFVSHALAVEKYYTTIIILFNTHVNDTFTYTRTHNKIE